MPTAPQFEEVLSKADAGSGESETSSTENNGPAAVLVEPDATVPNSPPPTSSNVEASLDSSACPDETAKLQAQLATLWGPAARIHSLQFQADGATARQSGCQTVGFNDGLGAQQLPQLIGFDFEDAVQEQEDGSIDLIILAH